jgi:hypothetical protein
MQRERDEIEKQRREIQRQREELDRKFQEQVIDSYPPIKELMNPHLINNLLNNIISLLLDGNIKIKI